MPQMTVNGVSLHYELAGKGDQAVVLIHGGCCAASDWRRQIDALCGEFTVLAMDLRGHGASGGGESALSVAQWAADVNALMEGLAIRSAVIVGHSLGSRIAAEAAWQQPDHAAALVLLDGSRTVGGFAATAPRHDVAETPTQDLAIILDRTIGPYAAAGIRQQVIQTMSSPPEAVMWAAARALAEWDRERADVIYSSLPEGLPVLAIQSTYHDAFTPRRSFATADEDNPYLAWLRSAVPELMTTVLPETGHFSMVERADTVTGLIRDFGRAAMHA